MIAHLLLPLFLLLLVMVQTTLLDYLTMGWVGLELSLVVVVYCGFRLGPLRGAVISLTLGFFMDCLISGIFGLYMFLYLLLFYFSLYAAGMIYSEKALNLVLFTGLCTLLEGLATVLLYRLLLGRDILHAIPEIFLPKAIILGILSPFLFRLFHRFEVLLHAKESEPAQRV
ncbi:MAG: rod shape-determining protein MreD [Thermodesulfobacteriota bacterium]